VSGHRVDLDAAAIAAVVRSCALVDGLHSGRHGRIVTPDGEPRQIGVLVADTVLIVGVVGRPDAATGDIVTEVRAALSEYVPGYQVTVSVEPAWWLASESLASD
jgi:hypothetical protein